MTEQLRYRSLVAIPGTQSRMENEETLPNLFGTMESFASLIKPNLHIFYCGGGRYVLALENPAIGGRAVACANGQPDVVLVPGDSVEITADPLVLFLEDLSSIGEPVVQIVILDSAKQ